MMRRKIARTVTVVSCPPSRSDSFPAPVHTLRFTITKAWLGQEVAGVVDGAGRYPGGADQPHRLVLGVAPRPFGDERVDLGAVRGALVAVEVLRVVGKVRALDRGREPR